MTASDQIERIPIAPSAGHHLAAELGETLKLGAPMAATQLGRSR